LTKNKVTQIQTGIRGRKPDGKKLNLSDFEIKQAKSGKPTRITCAQVQAVSIQLSSQKKGYVAHFDADICQDCPLVEVCPAQRGKRDTHWHLRFTEPQMHVSQRRRRNKKHEDEAHNLRAAVEATVRQVKHPFPASKLPVRGCFRMSCMMMASAMMTNVRRIQSCLDAKRKPKKSQDQGKEDQKHSEKPPLFSFLLNKTFDFFYLLVIILEISPLRLVNLSLLQ